MKSSRLKKRKSETIQEKDYNNGKIISIIYILILVVAFFKVYPTIFDEKIDLNGDNIQYYLLGTSIANGDGYSDIRVPEKPPTSRFPPGYPLIISVVMKVFSSDISTIKSANGFFLLISVILLFLLFLKVLKNVHLSFVISMLILLNSHLLKSSTIMMSEITYLFFSALGLYFLILLDYDKPFFKSPYFYFMIISVAFSYHIRTTGIALFGGILLVFILKKEWKYLAGFIGGFVLLCLPWFLREKSISSSSAGSYMSSLMYKNPYRKELGSMEFQDWFIRLFKNFERYVTREIPSGTLSFINVKYTDPIAAKEWIIGVLIVVAIVYGLITLKSYRPIIFSYLLGNFGIMLLWPEVWYGPRFILPIIPLLVLLMGSGIYTIIRALASKINIQNKLVIQVILPLLLLISVFAFTSPIEKLNNASKLPYHPNYKNYFELAVWAQKNIPDDAVVSCRKSELFFIFSKRYTTGYSQTANKEELINGLIESKVDYVVLDELGYSSTARYLYPTIKRYPEKFKSVKRIGNSNSYLLEFRPNIGYWGDFVNDKKEGFGTFTWENGNRFEGEWKEDKREGEGKFILPNGEIFSGKWSNDKMNGEITHLSPQGDILERGFYKDNILVRTLK